VDQAGQCQITPAAWEVLKAARGTGLIDLEPALAHDRHLGQFGNEALQVHPLEQLRSLEAVAHCYLPQPFWLGRAKIASSP